jgi:hypothetical protein
VPFCRIERIDINHLLYFSITALTYKRVRHSFSHKRATTKGIKQFLLKWSANVPFSRIERIDINHLLYSYKRKFNIQRHTCILMVITMMMMSGRRTTAAVVIVICEAIIPPPSYNELLELMLPTDHPSSRFYTSQQRVSNTV